MVHGRFTAHIGVARVRIGAICDENGSETMHCVAGLMLVQIDSDIPFVGPLLLRPKPVLVRPI